MLEAAAACPPPRGRAAANSPAAGSPSLLPAAAFLCASGAESKSELESRLTPADRPRELVAVLREREGTLVRAVVDRWIADGPAQRERFALDHDRRRGRRLHRERPALRQDGADGDGVVFVALVVSLQVAALVELVREIHECRALLRHRARAAEDVRAASGGAIFGHVLLADRLRLERDVEHELHRLAHRAQSDGVLTLFFARCRRTRVFRATPRRRKREPHESRQNSRFSASKTGLVHLKILPRRRGSGSSPGRCVVLHTRTACNAWSRLLCSASR